MYNGTHEEDGLRALVNGQIVYKGLMQHPLWTHLIHLFVSLDYSFWFRTVVIETDISE